MSDRALHRDDVMRRALWVTVFFNIGGGLAIAFPSSLPGQLVGLPAPVPMVYSFTLALFVLLFAGTYAWLAQRPQIDRPLVAFLAIGKASFFALMFILWLAGSASGRLAFVASGDLVFAVLFARWLLHTEGGVVQQQLNVRT